MGKIWVKYELSSIIYSKSEIEEHMQKHILTCMKRQTYKCSDCKEVFSLKKSLIGHMDSVHGKKRQYLDYKCPDCEKSFTSYGAMAKHIKMGNQIDHKNIDNNIVKKDGKQISKKKDKIC